MESAWRINSSSSDRISPADAYNLMGGDIGRIISELQEEGEAVIVAGGFVSFALGLTKEYGDIDVFVHPYSYIKTYKKLSEANLTLRYHTQQQQGSDPYPEREYEVFNVFRNETNTGLQLIILLKNWVYMIANTRLEDGVNKPDPSHFARTLMRDFDMQICRCALYRNSYIQR